MNPLGLHQFLFAKDTVKGIFFGHAYAVVFLTAAESLYQPHFPSGRGLASLPLSSPEVPDVHISWYGLDTVEKIDLPLGQRPLDLPDTPPCDFLRECVEKFCVCTTSCSLGGIPFQLQAVICYKGLKEMGHRNDVCLVDKTGVH